MRKLLFLALALGLGLAANNMADAQQASPNPNRPADAKVVATPTSETATPTPLEGWMKKYCELHPVDCALKGKEKMSFHPYPEDATLTGHQPSLGR